MRLFQRLFFLIALISIACNSSDKNTPEVSIDYSALSYKLDEYFNTLSTIKKFNGGVLVQKEGKVILHAVYQMEADSLSSLSVRKYSQFDIHSISKLMAKACVVKLESKNLIHRKHYVKEYLPDFPNGGLITIEHLLNNQSGLPREFSKAYPDLIEKTPEELVDFIKQEQLLFEPGTETLYSNLGYQLLYYIISKITNQPFVQFLDQEFFIPLQMNSSGAHFYLKKDKLKYLVKNHENEDGAIIVTPNIEADGKNQAKIYSTMGDLLKFINFVKQEPYNAALKNSNDEIAWSGGGDGILSHAKASLKSGYEVVFFSNYDDIPFGDIIETVEKIMTDQPYDLPEAINRQAVQLDRSTLEQYTGKYRMKEFNNDIFEFRIEADHLVFYQNGERNTGLYAENDSTFFDRPDAEDFFIFEHSNTGEYELIFFFKKVAITGKKISSQ